MKELVSDNNGSDMEWKMAIIVNLVIGLSALFLGYDLNQVLVLFMFEWLVVGILTAFKIILGRDAVTEEERRIESTSDVNGKFASAIIFLLMYGLLLSFYTFILTKIFPGLQELLIPGKIIEDFGVLFLIIMAVNIIGFIVSVVRKEFQKLYYGVHLLLMFKYVLAIHLLIIIVGSISGSVLPSAYVPYLLVIAVSVSEFYVGYHNSKTFPKLERLQNRWKDR